jgi:hypothetical protein
MFIKRRIFMRLLLGTSTLKSILTGPLAASYVVLEVNSISITLVFPNAREGLTPAPAANTLLP